VDSFIGFLGTGGGGWLIFINFPDVHEIVQRIAMFLYH
jgi:hypothetical protein